MSLVGSETWSFWELISFFGPKIAFALVCGGIVGLERELKRKTAGIKTNILICVGSALYTALSVLISGAYARETGFYGDPARIAAQIVPGIGFLGAGAIIQARGTILGLTTAATIWVVAAIGVCVGMGYLWIGLVIAIAVVAVLVFISILEESLLGKSVLFNCDIIVEDPKKGKVWMLVNQAVEENNMGLEDFDVTYENGRSTLKIKYRGTKENSKKFLLQIWKLPGVVEVKQQ